MKVKSVHFKQFKRFSDLKVENLPETAKLVVLAGPNGSGKSSFFEGLYSWYRFSWAQTGHSWDASYHIKQSEDAELSDAERVAKAKERSRWNEAIKVEFYGVGLEDVEERRKAVYVRSAYRNDPSFQISSLSRMGSPLGETRFSRLSDNDATVGQNYQRLASQNFKAVFVEEAPETTIGQFR